MVAWVCGGVVGVGWAAAFEAGAEPLSAFTGGGSTWVTVGGWGALCIALGVRVE